MHSAERKGFEKGLDKGLQKGKLETARDLLAMGLTVDQIVKAMGLSVSDVEKPQEAHH